MDLNMLDEPTPRKEPLHMFPTNSIDSEVNMELSQTINPKMHMELEDNSPSARLMRPDNYNQDFDSTQQILCKLRSSG